MDRGSSVSSLVGFVAAIALVHAVREYAVRRVPVTKMGSAGQVWFLAAALIALTVPIANALASSVVPFLCYLVLLSLYGAAYLCAAPNAARHRWHPLYRRLYGPGAVGRHRATKTISRSELRARRRQRRKP